MVTSTDEELMLRFQTGDEAAFDALYERHAPALYRYFARVAGGRASAEDLLQTTFASVIRARDRFELGARFTPWLFTIAANAARDHLRQRQRAGLQEPLDGHELPGEFAPPGDPGLAARLEVALQRLPLAHREAVVLHHLMGFSFQELAEMLGTSSTAVRLRAHRGYTALRADLADLREDA